MNTSGMDGFRTMVVDDEAPARELMQLMLKQYPSVELLGCYAGAKSLLQALRTHMPDLVFMDIGLPDGDGIELARRCIELHPDVFIVFVTAFDNRAIEAFELNALDYLLKPIEDSRLRETMDRLEQQQDNHRYMDRISWAMNSLDGMPNRENMVIRSTRKIDIIALKDVQYLRAAGNYVEVHVNGKTLMQRSTIDEMERRLSGGRFMRVHRSAIANSQFVTQITTDGKGHRTLEMENGDRVDVSDTYKRKVLASMSPTLAPGKVRLDEK
jgi:two-component system LytT family response regulator